MDYFRYVPYKMGSEPISGLDNLYSEINKSQYARLCSLRKQ